MTAPDDDAKLFDCPVLETVNVIAGKWKSRVLWLLRDRPYGFNELGRTLPGVSAKVLIDQIRSLEDDGIIRRSERVERGTKHVDYCYTDYGLTLIPVLNAVGAWGLAHQTQRPSGGQ